MTNYILTGALFLLTFYAIPVAVAQDSPGMATTNNTVKKALTESQKIEHLITSMRSLKGASFIRNGSDHTPQEAADHLEAKWKKHSDKIKSAEEFIKHLATKSSSSGEVYKIRFADGKIIPTSEVLWKELEQFEAESGK